MRAKRYNRVVLFLIYQIHIPLFFSTRLTSIASNVDRQTCHRVRRMTWFQLFPRLSQDQSRKESPVMLVLWFFNKRSSGPSQTPFFLPNAFSFLVLATSFLFQRFGPFKCIWLVFGIANLSRHPSSRLTCD